MKKIIFLLIFLAVIGCDTGEQESTATPEPEEDSLVTSVPEKADSTEVRKESPPPRPEVRFICRDIGEGLDNPLFEVSLLVENSYYTLDTIHTCNSIIYRDYEEFEIPREALSAAGGWWKKDGDYFFAIEDAGEIVVMHAWQTEEQSTQGYFYKVIRRILLPQPIPVQDL